MNKKMDKRSRRYYGIRHRWKIWLALLSAPLWIIPACFWLGVKEVWDGLKELKSIFEKNTLAYLFGARYDPKSVLEIDHYWKDFD